MGIYEELHQRGLLAQVTHEEEVRDLLNKGGRTFYIGFDPTADSLHVGHYMQLVIMARMQRAGHRPIALLGGGTAMVGDPTGRTDMRNMMTREMIEHNAECFKKQMSSLVDFEGGRALMLNNADWLLNLNYVEFLRDVGVHFSVNRMLTAECVKTRLEKGLSFLEFNYMLMQGYDFYYLSEKYGCNMQLGGDDQWANILAGIELIRRKAQKDAYGVTFTLLTTSDGKKMGKTQSGAVWLDPEKTSPYDFYQYWRNVADEDVIRCLKMLTFLPVEEIEARFGDLEGKDLNAAKETLAFEVTKQVHGSEEAEKASAAARALFVAGRVSDDMPTVFITAGDLPEGGITVADLLAKTGITPSKSEARRLVEQGGIAINDEKVKAPLKIITVQDFNEGFIIIKKGKKSITKVELE